MGFWLPPAVSAELLNTRRQFEADLQSRMVREEMLRVKGILDQFNYELQRIDPKLEMCRAGEDTHGTQLRAGFYHLVRWNDNAPPSVFVIDGDDGEFVEPTGRVFDRLKEMDLWDPANIRLRDQRERLAEEAAARQKARDRADHVEELRDRVNAATRTSVSLNRSIPWSQNQAGRRGHR